MRRPVGISGLQAGEDVNIISHKDDDDKKIMKDDEMKMMRCPAPALTAASPLSRMLDRRRNAGSLLRKPLRQVVGPDQDLGI